MNRSGDEVIPFHSYIYFLTLVLSLDYKNSVWCFSKLVLSMDCTVTIALILYVLLKKEKKTG